MQKHLGPIEVDCDAPPYSVVQACRFLGLRRPEDVRWARLSQFLRGCLRPPQPSLWEAFCGLFRPRAPHAGPRCACGRPLPPPREAAFTFNTGATEPYVLIQCPRCHTVFWDEA